MRLPANAAPAKTRPRTAAKPASLAAGLHALGLSDDMRARYTQGVYERQYGQPHGSAVGHYVAVSRRPTNTTSVDGLLERSAQLAALDEHLGAVRAQGRGRLVLIGGEAGIGKTSLVRAFCEEQRVDPGAVGRVRRAVHAASARAVRRHRAGGRRRARGGRRAGRDARPSSSRRWRASSAGALRASWCWRICTGPTRPRSTSFACSPVASSRSRRWCWRPTATTSSTAPIRCGSCSASSRGTRPTGSRWPRSRRGAVAALAGSADVDPGELHRRTAGNPFFVTEVLATADDAIPETVRDAVLARDRAPGRGRAGAARRRRGHPAARRAVAAGGAGGRRPGAARRVPGLRRPARRPRRRQLSPRDRAGRGRGGALAAPPPGAASQGARGAGGAWRRAPTRPASPITPRPPTTPSAVLRHAPVAGERGGRAGVTSRGGGAVRPRAALRGRPRARAPRRAARAPLVRVLPDQRLRGRHRSSPPRARTSTARRATGAARATATAGSRACSGSSATTRRAEERGTAGGGAARAARRPAASSRWPTATWRSCGCSRTIEPAATSWGERAIELAERLGETEIVVHALNNVGAAEMHRGLRRRPGQARAQPRDGARRRPRGARRPRVHQPRRRRASSAATTRSATPISTPGSPIAQSTTSTRGWPT